MSSASRCTLFAKKHTQDPEVLTRRSLELKVLLLFKTQLFLLLRSQPETRTQGQTNVKTQYFLWLFFLDTGRNAVISGTVSFADRLW